MFDWEGLKEKSDKWKKLFDETAKLIGDKTITFDRHISTFYRFAPRAYEITNCKEIKIDDNLIKGDMVLTVTNGVGQDFRIIISRAFEAKAFGNITNVEILLIKIKDYLIKRNKQELEDFASAPL